MSEKSTTIISAEELARLGLEGFQRGTVEALDWAEAPIAQALGVREAVGLVALVTQFQGGAVPSFTEARHPLLSGVGLQLERGLKHTDVLRLRGLASPPVVLDTEGTPIESPEPLRGGQTVYVDLREHPRLVVRVGERALAVSATDTGLAMQLLEGVRVPPIAEAIAPLDLWAMNCADTWLASRLTWHAQFADAWHSAVGAGMACRLIEPSTVVGDSATGCPRVPNPVIKTVRHWILDRSPEARNTFLRLALAEVDGLLAAGDDLESDEASPPQERWDSWLDVFRRRDDLESVRTVLFALLIGSRLDEALAPLDNLGKSWRLMVPEEYLRRDEQLRRVGREDPTAWWGSPDSSVELR
jgi:hypothetical protein